MDGASAESDSMYEGVDTGDATADGEGSVDGRPVAGKERSGTLNLESLTKNTKPENIEGVIRKGIILFCLRSEGFYMYIFRKERRAVPEAHVHVHVYNLIKNTYLSNLFSFDVPLETGVGKNKFWVGVCCATSKCQAHFRKGSMQWK